MSGVHGRAVVWCPRTPKGSCRQSAGADTPFRVAVLGDFGGRASRDERRDGDTIAKLKGVVVSRDTLEDVMARLKVAIKVPLPDDETATVHLQSLDDFHPDELYGKIDKFEDLDNDDDKAALMRAVLHHPPFQDVEAAWRGLDLFLKRVHKTGSGIEVVLFDITFDELAADLTADEDLTASGLYRTLLAPIVEAGKAQPYALLIGSFTFDLTPEHIGVLGRLGKFAGVAAAPLLAGATPRVLDSAFTLDGEAAEAWNCAASTARGRPAWS